MASHYKHSWVSPAGWDLTGSDKEALGSERPEATLLPLTWILITLFPDQKSCLLSLQTQPGPSKAGETVQNGLQPFVVPVYGSC